MTALEALQMLKDYYAEEEKRRKSVHYKMPFYYYGFSDRYMTVHETGAPPEKGYYDIDLDGSVIKTNEFIKSDNHVPSVTISLSDLTGDYEIYNPVQTYKCGYIIFNNKNINIDCVLSKLYNKINHINDNCGDVNLQFCRRCHVDNVTYYSPESSPSVEGEIFKIRDLISYNTNRVKVGLAPYPFKKNIGKSSVAVYVKFVEFDHYVIYGGKKAREDRFNKALTNLLSYIDEDCKWVEMKSRKPLYE